MNRKFLLLLTAIITLMPCFSSFAQELPEASQSDIWKYNKNVMLAFSTGKLDQKIRFGGEISSRWGLSFVTGRNIFLHKKAIGGFLRFGLDVNLDVNYLNFAKGSGKMSDLWGGNSSFENGMPVTFGRHFVTAGLAVGPSASFAPFFRMPNKNLSVLRFRPYFNVVPSYAGYIVSDSDETELHNAFALWCQAGMQIQWKRLIFGVEWKGTTAKFKGLSDSLLDKFDENYTSSGSYKFDINMVNIMIGIGL